MSVVRRQSASAVAAVSDRRASRAHAGVADRPPLRWRNRNRAFTLVELLVVVGLIVFLTLGGAIALGGRGSEGMALANAQSMVASMLGAARAQAALHQTKARLVVYASAPPGSNVDANKYLRALVVLREEPVDSGRYLTVGDHLVLPAPICIVPTNVPRTHLAAGVNWPTFSSTSPHSTLEAPRGNFSYRSQANATATPFFGTAQTSGQVYYIEFLPDGTVAPFTTITLPASSTIRLAMSPAILGGNALPQFNSPNAIRGIVIRKSGALSLVDEATGF